MGKAEKIVVLSIIFLVVVLFVWSLGGESNAAEKKGTGDDATKVAAQEPEQRTPTFGRREPATNTETPAGGEEASTPQPSNDPFLGGAGEEAVPTDDPAGSGLDMVDPEPVQALTVRMRPGWDIVSTEGLEPTIDPDTLSYRPTEGQTWEEIADAVYGDAAKAILLRHNNEGMAAPGEVVLVPAKAGSLEELGERLAVVRQGESLWGVARRTLGKGSRWREIFEANRDVIADPDYVAPGTELSIPAR